MGFTTEAMNKTKALFDDDGIYEIVFKKRITQHGLEKGTNFARGRADILDSAPARPPSADILLASYLCREAARALTPDQRHLREEAIERLNLDKVSLEERNRLLKDDRDYAVKYILRGTVFVFVEMVGLLMFRAFGDGVYDSARKFISNGSLGKFRESYYPEVIVAAHAKRDDGDVLMILWEMYEYIISGLVYDISWFNRWKIESNLSRFHYSDETRRRIFDRIGELETMIKMRPLEKPWSTGPDKAGGITTYLQRVLT